MSDAALSTPAAAIVEPWPRLIDAHAEGRLFWRTRRWIARSSLKSLFATARLRMSLVALLSVLFWLGVYRMFLDAFRYVAPYEETVHGVFNVFFAALMVLLIFSTGVILYGGLYRSREVDFLLTTPARAGRVFLHKFQEAQWFASWGFFLLGSPMLVAYGRVAGAPWYYYLLIIPYMVMFAWIPSAMGAIACLLIVRFMPRVRKQVLFFAGFFTLAFAVWLGWSLVSSPDSDLLTPGWLKDTSARLRYAEQRLLPSWWFSAGLWEASRREDGLWQHRPWQQSVLFLSLLTANALFFHQLAVWTAVRLLRPSYQRLHGEFVRRRRIRTDWMDRMAMLLSGFLSMPIRILIVKDLRMFRRDPLQWSQFLIFFGLLSLYFFNIRRFSFDVRVVEWINMIGFLNLSVVGLILSTFTTRFTFPMINLEGRRFWILGRAPMPRETVLWAKFLFTSIGSLVPCMSLMALSDLMLPIDAPVVAIHLIACAVLCFGLSGLAVGLGAALLDMRQESPSKIAAGFGGTLNLVLSAVFIAIVVLCTAIPCHHYVANKSVLTGWALLDRQMSPAGWMFAGISVTVLFGAVATIIPLRLGFRAFRELEL